MPAPTQTLAPWRARPVFISSTFRDMHAKRGWLQDYVFPELQDRLRQRHGHLETIDLRWGIETVSLSERHAKRLLILKVCLGEIERSRPFLIALLGDRYGTVMPGDRLQAAAREAGYETDARAKSITVLEIEYGVLDSADQRRRSHFYFREPLPYAEMDPATAAEYSEDFTGDPQAAERKAALDALKVRIEKLLPDRTHRYPAKWDQAKKCVTGLEAFGQMVLEDLWQDLELEFPPLEQRAATTWQDEEQAALEQFIEQRNRDFVGRDELLRGLKEFALGNGPLTPSLSPSDGERVSARTGEGQSARTLALSLTGPPGSGKSAVLCRLHRLLEREDALLLTHAAGISLHAGSVDRMLLRWISQLAAALGRPAPVGDDAKPDDIEPAFATLLGQASAQRRVVVLVDALNQSEPTVRARYLTWLPKIWPPNARLIATSLPGPQAEALLASNAFGVPALAGQEAPDRLKAGLRTTAAPRGVVELPLAPLNRPEAELMAERVCGRYHRHAPGEAVRELMTKQTPDGQPAAGSPLWLELALEELNLLDQDDFQRAEQQYSGTGEEKLGRLLLDTARALPPDVAGLYGWMFDRAGELWGKPWADAFLSLTALSRAGWRESDLEKLLPKAAEIVALAEKPFTRPADTLPSDGERLHEPPTLTNGALEPSAVVGRVTPCAPQSASDDPNGAHGVTRPTLPFTERDGVRGAPYAWDPVRFAGLRRSFRAHLLPRGALGQWDFHHAQARLAVAARSLQDAEEVKRLHCFCADHLLALPDADPLRESETMHHLIGADDRLRTARFYAQPTPPAEATRTLARFVLIDAKEDDSPGLRWTRSLLELPELEQELLSWLCNNFNFHLDDALENEARLGVRLNLLEATRAALQRLVAANPSNVGWLRDLSVSHNRLGDVLSAQGDLAGALGAYRSSLAIRERLAATDPSNAGWQHNLCVGQERLGDVLRDQGDLAGALGPYRSSLAILERLAAAEPSKASWQRDLGVSQEKLGDVLRDQGDLAGALAAYRQALAVSQRLATADPSNAGWQRDLSVCHNKWGDVLSDQGDLAGALAAYREALAVRQRLAAADPSNAGWQRDLSVSQGLLGGVLSAQGDLAGALSAYRASLAVRERLAASDPSNAAWQRDLSVSQKKLGDVLSAQGDLAGALAAYRASLAIRERLAASDPSNAVWQRDLAVSRYKLGMFARQNGDRATQVAELQKCFAVLDSMKRRGLHFDPALAQVYQQLAQAFGHR